MVRWKAYGVLVLYVCVFTTCISAETQETGSTRHVWPAHFLGGVIVTTPSRTKEDATTQSSAGTIVFSCDKCVHGFCSRDTCLCQPGWKGVFCDIDIDECKKRQHHCHRTLGVCTNTLGSYNCSCIEGLDGDGFNCEAPLFNYPYTSSAPRKGDDVVYGPYPIYGGLAYFGQKYQKLYVSTNGYMSLGKKYSKVNPFADDTFPLNTAIIAPYWTDLDLSSGQGALYIDTYSELDQTEKGAQIFSQFTKDITRWRNVTFMPTFVVVATWEKALAYPVYLFNESESISFQVVLGTDSRQSFLLYDYGSGIMKWGDDVQWENHPILLGYSTGSSQGSLVKASDIYRPDLDSNVGEPGKYLYTLGVPITNSDLACQRWARQNNPSSSPQCPCELVQLKIDFRYRRVNSTCYAPRSIDPSLGDEFAPCCYDSKSGALLSAQAVLQARDSDKRVDDFLSPTFLPAYQTCCVNSDLCHLFYEEYADYTCDKYTLPLSSMVHGYMTFKTWDSEAYSYPALGQFVLVDLDNGTFVLQMRSGWQVSNLTGPLNITVPVAFAAKDVASERFEVRWTGDGDAVIHVGGERAGTMRTLPVGRQIWYNGVSIERLHATEMYHVEDVVVFFNTTQIAMRVHQMLGRLSVIVVMRTWNSEVQGLLAKIPGIKYTLRNGSTTKNNTDMIIDWEIRTDESLFTYSIDTTINTHFVVPNLWLPKVPKKLMSAFCDFDCEAYSFALMLNNQNFSDATKKEEEFYEEIHAYIYANTGPSFEKSPPAIRVVLGHSLTLSLGVDDVDEFSVRLDTNIQDKYTFDADNYKFVWTPSSQVMDGDALYLKFFGADIYDMATFYWPRLEVCACRNGAKCSFDYLTTTQHYFNPVKFYLATCECTEGYKGRFCGEVTDVCHPNPCYHDNSCTAVIGPPRGHKCGPCPDGLSGNGEKCGASCHDGFHLLDNGTCTDVNECEVECTELGQYCVNTVGSFECRCLTEYIVSTSGLACLFAPKRYYAKLTFGVVKTAEGYVPYSSEMNNTGSKLFKTVEKSVVRVITGVFDGLGLVTAHLAKVTQDSKQNPVAHVKLYFLQEAPVNLKKLAVYIRNRNFKKHAKKLIGAEGLIAEEWDLCGHDEDNTCDVTTTVCTMTDGRFECVCKDGFHNLNRDKQCQDVCSGSPCINGGKCVRDKHTYLCSCPEFWMGHNCTVKNEPAIRYKSAAVALGTAFGVITAILLIALLAIFVRTVTGKKRMLRTGSQKYRCRSVKEDELSKAVAALEVANTNGQHQSPDSKNDKPKDVPAPETGRENSAYAASTSADHSRQDSIKTSGQPNA